MALTTLATRASASWLLWAVCTPKHSAWWRQAVQLDYTALNQTRLEPTGRAAHAAAALLPSLAELVAAGDKLVHDRDASDLLQFALSMPTLTHDLLSQHLRVSGHRAFARRCEQKPAAGGTPWAAPWCAACSSHPPPGQCS